MRPDWFPDWAGQTCVIVASGPSAGTASVEQAQGRARVIAVNNSWRLAPWADVLYGCDFNWWKTQGGVPDFAGLKISQDDGWNQRCRQTYPDVRLVHCDRVYDRKQDLIARPGMTGWGGNSGFQALSLAVQFGANKIILVGYDMRVDLGVHWHGKHPKGLNNPQAQTADQWRGALDGAAKTLRDAGVTVINASPISALKNYPKMTLQEALAA